MSVCVRGSCKIGNTLFAFEVSELANNDNFLLVKSRWSHVTIVVAGSGSFKGVRSLDCCLADS